MSGNAPTVQRAGGGPLSGNWEACLIDLAVWENNLVMTLGRRMLGGE